MALVALLSAADLSEREGEGPRGLLRFAGQPLFAYQARQLRAIGVSQILLLIGAVPANVTAAIDGLRREGLEVRIVREAGQIVDALATEDSLFLMAEGLVAAPREIARVAGCAAPAMAICGDSPASAGFERLDRLSRWAGLAMLPAPLAVRTLGNFGEWDPMLTLVRAIAQADPARVAVDDSLLREGELVIVREGQTLASLEYGRIASRGIRHSLGDIWARPIAGAVASVMLRRGGLARWINWFDLALGGAALVGALLLPAAVAFCLVLIAAIGGRARAAVSVTALLPQRGSAERQLPALLLWAATSLAAWNMLGWDYPGSVAVAAALLLFALLALADMGEALAGEGLRGLCLDVETTALILLLFVVLGFASLGLAVAVAGLLASLFWVLKTVGNKSL